MKQRYLLILFLTFCSEMLSANVNPVFLKKTNDHWVDSLMNNLTLEQKIGQLFMIQAYSNGKNQQPDELITLINQHQVGGVIFMQGGPLAQAKICNKLQQASNVPLLIAIDGETGLGFRLDSTIKYPVQMALGAITNDSLIYRMGFEIGQQCRRIGIHMNMAPVCDINVDPENPIINYRSFGEDKLLVAQKSWLYAKGMQDAGVLATAKHFPGHGDTKADSHLNLPVISKTKNQLDSLELFPFVYLIEHGISAIMTGHLQVPAIEPNEKIPGTLSAKMIGKILKKEMNFTGLIITDAMNMKGLGNLYSSAESAVKALKAGNDMVEIMPRLDRAIEAVKQAVKSGDISINDINEKCRKVLAAKKWLGLDHQRMVETENLFQELNKPKYELTKRLLLEQSLTVLSNHDNLLPLQRLDTLRIASLMVGVDQISPFQKILDNYTTIDHFILAKNASEEEIDNMIGQLKPYNLLIIGFQGMNMYPNKRFGITDQLINLSEKIKNIKSVVCFFGNAYALQNFPALQNQEGLVMAFQDDPIVQEMAGQLIFGAIDANGKLPVTINSTFPFGSGIHIQSNKRLKYTLPEEVNIDSKFLQEKIDSIAFAGLKGNAFPGCQVLIAKNGKVIMKKSYGYLSSKMEQPVQNNNLYDLASVTKVTTSLPAMMKMYDENRINLDAPFANYFQEFKKTNKSEMTLRDVLTHQGKLQSSLPFWLEPGSQTKLRNQMFRNQPSDKYSVRVSANLYARNDMKDLIVQDIIKSPLKAKKEYVYSDLGFGLFPMVIERITNENFQEYLNKEFYKPLGAATTGYKPYEHFPIDQIAPTENDQYFRKELLLGYVHDELAALLGGVSGNAGLFSSANDLAKLMQMYLQLGFYGGKQYISAATVDEFTKVQWPEPNHRSLGFDKPSPGIRGQKNKFPAADASPSSYGHTGFTGTFVWNDPENQLLFIFLSNRVNPTRRNTALSDLNIRTNMQQAIYDAIKKGVE